MFKNITKLFKPLLNQNQSCINSGKNLRNLYAPASMGIDGYIMTRERTKNQLIASAEKFREKMQEFLKDNTKNMIFSEDLKNMIHIAEKTPEDIQLVKDMLKKFHSQNQEIRFGTFIFGPVVMRLLYYLKDDETALQLFRDPELGSFFNQLISYQLLLDLLYEKKRYQDVIDLFNDIKSRQVEGGKYPRHVVVLTFASCYKLNTPDSFNFSSNLWKELQEVGHVPMRKGVCFAAALALKQNAPHIALEMLSNVKQANYLTVRNLKCIALADVGRVEDSLPILRAVLEINDPTMMKHTFVKEAVEKVKESIKKINNKEIEHDFNKIEKFLNDYGHISDSTLDDILCTEMTGNTTNEQKPFRRDRSILAASFNQRNPRNFKDKRSMRPGLKDMY